MLTIREDKEEEKEAEKPEEDRISGYDDGEMTGE